MRFLFLSNLYPPAHLGGWELMCRDIAGAFIDRGHQVEVLTSRFQKEMIEQDDPNIHRELYLESDVHHYNPVDYFLQSQRNDERNFETLTRNIQDFQPDAVVVWGMWLLNPQLAALAEKLCPGRVAYYFCGYWPIEEDPHSQYWRAFVDNKRLPGWLSQRISRQALARQENRSKDQLEFRHVTCVSQAVLDILREGGIPLPNATVTYNGIDLDEFYAPLDQKGFHTPLRLMYAGSLGANKGVDTAVQAVALLSKKFSPGDVHLTLVGKGHPAFEDQLHQIIGDAGIEQFVTMTGWIDRVEMPQVLHQHDVLLFPSRWPEPLARMMMEGMAAGLTLVSTTTGGTAEFLEHRQNSLTFEAGDAVDLAHQIDCLLSEPGLARRLAKAGQELALEQFDENRMYDEIEEFAVQAAQQTSSVSP
ncbi:MAG: glycosyltransferase family 4 protein [Chloroflexota bacterium]|nr:glycosyltransferase family 4 protein [Chloroflexota bacterium]